MVVPILEIGGRWDNERSASLFDVADPILLISKDIELVWTEDRHLRGDLTFTNKGACAGVADSKHSFVYG